MSMAANRALAASNSGAIVGNLEDAYEKRVLELGPSPEVEIWAWQRVVVDFRSVETAQPSRQQGTLIATAQGFLSEAEGRGGSFGAVASACDEEQIEVLAKIMKEHVTHSVESTNVLCAMAMDDIGELVHSEPDGLGARPPFSEPIPPAVLDKCIFCMNCHYNADGDEEEEHDVDVPNPTHPLFLMQCT